MLTAEQLLTDVMGLTARSAQSLVKGMGVLQGAPLFGCLRITLPLLLVI